MFYGNNQLHAINSLALEQFMLNAYLEQNTHTVSHTHAAGQPAHARSRMPSRPSSTSPQVPGSVTWPQSIQAPTAQCTAASAICQMCRGPRLPPTQHTNQCRHRHRPARPAAMTVSVVTNTTPPASARRHSFVCTCVANQSHTCVRLQHVCLRLRLCVVRTCWSRVRTLAASVSATFGRRCVEAHARRAHVNTNQVHNVQRAEQRRIYNSNSSTRTSDAMSRVVACCSPFGFSIHSDTRFGM